MRVICIEEDKPKCINSSRMVPVPQVGDYYTVIETRWSSFGNYYCYILEEMPHDVGYPTRNFAIPSDIDETELANTKQLINQ